MGKLKWTRDDSAIVLEGGTNGWRTTACWTCGPVSVRHYCHGPGKDHFSIRCDGGLSGVIFIGSFDSLAAVEAALANAANILHNMGQQDAK